MSDDQLYKQYLAGDGSAGDSLMIRYADVLKAYLDSFLHNPQDAEDLMLDCFTIILVRKPAIKEGGFKAYLFKVARNKATRLWRFKSDHPEFDLDEELPLQGDLPEDSAVKDDRSRILQHALNNIAPQYREALWLFYFMDMGYDQAAKVMGCSKKKIANLLQNGKSRLRAELEKEGMTYADI
ncbi:MAG: sigma-70 family RNA polymerase sigma factor [Lachnospiraceae bacterium]|nr:sigma-70 family RNA polymerase sigma factor [Lachnospiraceae bacterium]